MWFQYLLLVPLLAASVPLDDHHAVKKPLSGRWYHNDDHPVHSLFRRGPNDGSDYPAVGSNAWSANFPTSAPDVDQLPKAWVDALDAAVAANKIPDIPPSFSNARNVDPVYFDGWDPTGQDVCSATYQCRHPEDHWDAPDGYFASSFDDGPQPMTDTLVAHLQQNNVRTTHFMIGVNILLYWRQFITAFEAGDDIAVHTWTHPYMTTQSNLEVLGQLGWTMELIRRSTGGRVPRFWRPPYGDTDNRVRAIAKEVFGLETVIWNHDTVDWGLEEDEGERTSMEDIHEHMTTWLTGPKSPGLVILEHETSDNGIAAFIENFPAISNNGWKFESLARLLGDGVYQNSKDSNSDVELDDIITGSPSSFLTSSTSISSSSSSDSSPFTSQQGTTSETPTSGNRAANQPETTNDALSLFHRSRYFGLASIILGASWTIVLALWF